ncbi:DUF4176 domain-containing protein [Bacillus sp. FJAT-51639]|uniref:DUF4176 domain-containing protein n=1 Tax=Bacillus bruguierae TaxID=3127667 RepID=A0ABU8FCW4_9BACI
MQFSKERLLQSGSIVPLKEETEKSVIYGRKQMFIIEEAVMYDYIGCFYLEGHMNPDYAFVFNYRYI